MIASKRRFFIVTFLVSFIAILGGSRALAGGGPENVLLVVNPQSVDSMTVANHYIKMRDIPAHNVFYLDWDPDLGKTGTDRFRAKILKPILDTIQNRGLLGQIDYVVYSTDYPWGIELLPDIDRFLKQQKELAEAEKKAADSGVSSEKPKYMTEWPKELTKRGSLTGLTYLYETVLYKPPFYTSLNANHYMRIMRGNQQTVPTIAFSNRLKFDKEGKPTKEKKGGRYLLSVALGVTNKHGRRGNTVEEIIQYLQRSVNADGTFPQGVVYFDAHNDRRSEARQPGFAAAMAALAQLGIQSEIVSQYPPRRNLTAANMKTAGMTTGSPSVNLRYFPEILPGAIADNLTSTGAIMAASAGQTPITDFLAAGAAGASGAVFEPYAIPQKFPNPMIHAHYARGCSLAEAFYQSIHGPYQMLIVGEPLCKPWAHVPQVSIKMKSDSADTSVAPHEIEPNEKISGKVTIIPSSQHSDGVKAHHFEVYLDGQLIGICLYGGDIPINFARFRDGYYELRVVAVGPQPVYTRGYKVVTIQADNNNQSIEVEHSPAKEVAFGEPIQIQATCPDAKVIVVYHNGRSVGFIKGSTGKVEIDTKKLGKGPVTLKVVGILGKDLKHRVSGKPFSMEIK